MRRFVPVLLPRVLVPRVENEIRLIRSVKLPVVGGKIVARTGTGCSTGRSAGGERLGPIGIMAAASSIRETGRSSIY